MHGRFRSKASSSERYIIVRATLEDPENPGAHIDVFLIYDTAKRSYLPGVHLKIEDATAELDQIISLGTSYNS